MEESEILKIRILLIPILVSTMLACGLFCPSTATAADTENCLICHKYPLLARIDENGVVKDYYINQHLFLNSLHGTVECRWCHDGIKVIPHDPIDSEVNCASQCHVKPPFTTEEFSHEKIIGVFNSSIHGKTPGDSQLMTESKPDCKYCHLNPLYMRIDEMTVSYGKTLDRCLNCHPKSGVIQAYRHITHRLRHKTSRSSQDVVSLCADNCHGDTQLMRELGASEAALTAVETYRESIHGKMTALGSEKAADCVSCHASSLIHDIFKKDNPNSSINEKNILTTCRNCHSKIDEYFVKIAVHPSLKEPHNPVLFVVSNMVLRFILYGTVFGLMGLLFLESFRRKKDGMRMKITAGSSWAREGKPETMKSEGPEEQP